MPTVSGMVPTLKRSAAALRDAGIPFLVAGGVASWVRGGPTTDHDLDFLVKPEDADRALGRSSTDAGLRPEIPPEEMAVQGVRRRRDGRPDLLPAGLEVNRRGDRARRGSARSRAMTMRVMTPEDLLVTKLMAMTEHTLNYGAASRSPGPCASRSTGTTSACARPRRRSAARSS